MKREEEIAQKRAEVENYQRMVTKYQSGRWMHLYLDRLKQLQAELAQMENSPE